MFKVLQAPGRVHTHNGYEETEETEVSTFYTVHLYSVHDGVMLCFFLMLELFLLGM
jgi:hypothetical protein